MPSGFPDFEEPPVVEVSLGIQFDSLPLTTPEIGLLSRKFEDWLPKIDEKPPLDTATELFGVKPKPRTRELVLRDEPIASRVWFSDETRSELVQVQPNRFHFNWLKGDKEAPYPRYGSVEKKFLKALGLFEAFLRDQSLDGPVINQCEVVYVNHILPAEGIWTDHSESAKVISLLSNAESEFLPALENVQVAAKYLIQGSGEDPVGRLHITLTPRFFFSDGSPLLWLQLTARGVPLGEGTEGCKAFFRLGREWIVKGFVDITSKAMHKHWKER